MEGLVEDYELLGNVTMIRLRASNLDQVYAIRAWLEENLGKGSEEKSWKSAINDQIIYRCNDGFSWVMSYNYYKDLIVEISGMDQDAEMMLKLRFDSD